MSTCQHRNTTFSRDICPDPCGVMHTWCDKCGWPVDYCDNLIVIAATPAERAAADELTRELDSVYGEPTETDLARARFAIWPESATDDPDGLLWQHALAGDKDAVKRVAQAVAAERAAIHARYENVAVDLDQFAELFTDWTNKRVVTGCAARIRKVAQQ